VNVSGRELCTVAPADYVFWELLNQVVQEEPSASLDPIRLGFYACRTHNIHLIWTPTNASWLNPIECQFTHVKEFVIRNSDYADHHELTAALRRYANYRNPKKR
jgi:transposase